MPAMPPVLSHLPYFANYLPYCIYLLRCPAYRISYLSFLSPYSSILPYFALFLPRFVGGGGVDDCP